MTDSKALLEAFVTQGSEPAFRTLVDRYVHFVYSIARRLTDGDSQLAEDVTQTVFIGLAKHARTLTSSVALGGWLHQHTFHVATKAVRAERRRQVRERKAMEFNPPQHDTPDTWQRLAPVLDETIHRLGAEDRQAVLLRFFEQRDFRSVGEALGSSEDAARMRVQRALQKLRVLLREQGLDLTTAALAAALSVNAISAAPACLAASAAAAALSQAASSGLAFYLFKLMATLPAKLGVAALVLMGATTTLILQHQSHLRQRSQITTLRQQLETLAEENEALSNRLARANRKPTLRLPAPVLANTTPAGPSTENLGLTNLYSLVTNRDWKLSPAQLEPYLQANRRSATSLLAAFRTSGDPLLLAEAMQSFPNNPQVAYEAAIQRNASPDERRRWLDTLKSAAPDNALGNYLSAADHFKAGQVDQGVQDLVTAAGKTEFTDYTVERAQDDEEAYRAAGYPVAEAKLISNVQLTYPHMIDLRELSTQVLALADSYGQNGDPTSRQSALDLAAGLGRRYADPSAGESVICELVGLTIERAALATMDPQSPYNGGPQTVQERLDDVVQRRSAIRQLTKQADPFWSALTPDDWISYESRSAAFGEHAALDWMVAKYQQP
jgi:RNA polymerase sigma factor (sigma-70 family)